MTRSAPPTPGRTPEAILGLWREAERELQALDPDSKLRLVLTARVAELARAYGAAVDALMRDERIARMRAPSMPRVAARGDAGTTVLDRDCHFE
jgi:hypothetical protein